MNGPPVPKIVVGLRGSGRTHALIEWLTHGHRVSGWPGWSRLLIVSSPQTAVRLLRDFPDLQTRLHGLGTGGLGKLAVPIDSVLHLRAVSPDLEVAIDDAEHLLGHRDLRMLPRPSVIAITGEAVTPAELNAPSGMIELPPSLSPGQADQIMRRYGEVTLSAEQLDDTYVPPLADRIVAENREIRRDYDQRKYDHDAIYGALPVTDSIRCLASVGPDVGEQHCGHRGSWLRGRPGIIASGGDHPPHGWMGHESGWKAVRCPGGDR